MIAVSQKSFTDGELIKTVFIESAKTLFSNYRNRESIISQIEKLQFSHQTIQRRILILAEDILNQNATIIKSSISFSFALDETTDIKDISQLCIYFRAIKNDFYIVTDIFAISQLHLTTNSENIYKIFNDLINKYSIDLSKVQFSVLYVQYNTLYNTLNSGYSMSIYCTLVHYIQYSTTLDTRLDYLTTVYVQYTEYCDSVQYSWVELVGNPKHWSYRKCELHIYGNFYCTCTPYSLV